MEKKRRGYNKRAAKEHPGVTITEEVRDGVKRVLLRWRQPEPGGVRGKFKGCYALTGKGVDLLAKGQLRRDLIRQYAAKSRTAAHADAVRQSKEIQHERSQLQDVQPTTETKPEATWTELFANHQAYLTRNLRRPASIRAYRTAWTHVDKWRTRPRQPKYLTLMDLETFRAYMYAKHEGGKLSEHSVDSVLVHFKALLNYGRKRMKCVRLSNDDIAEGLKPVAGESSPISLETSKLRDILDAARAYDHDHPGAFTFPVLAFIMVTGCRLGEMQAVRWKASTRGAKESWPDFEAGCLNIYARKTSRPRVLRFDIRPGLKKLLETLHDHADVENEPFIFGGKLPLAVRDKREAAHDGDGVKIIGKSAKAALEAVRKASGADWKVKDLRSTAATYLANSRLYGSLLNTLADHMGHDVKVLQDHYLGSRDLPPKQRDAATVERVLGVHDIIEAWCKSQRGKGGRVIRLKRA